MNKPISDEPLKRAVEPGVGKVRRLMVAMAFFVTVPATVTAIIVGTGMVELPPWLIAALLVEVLCVEGMIFFFTARLVIMSEMAAALYESIIKNLKTIEQPLEGIGRILYNLKDVLPDVEDFLKKVDKEQVREFIRQATKQMEIKAKKISPTDIAAAAARLNGGKKNGDKVGGSGKQS